KRRTSRAEQQEINLHQTTLKSKSHTCQQAKTVETKPKHRRVETTPVALKKIAIAQTTANTQQK
ncbi:hypothetical protein, partial [Gardnerella greenwoodii]